MIRRLLAGAVEGMIRPPSAESPRQTARPDAVRRPPAPPARRWPEEAAEAPRRPPPEAAPPGTDSLSDALGLTSPAELRRAFLLIEVLGPPVSLRDPRETRRP